MPSLILAAFVLFTSAMADAHGAEYHGLVSMEDYYSSDSSAAYEFNLLTTRLRLDVDKLNQSGTLSFHFAGRERNNLGSQDYSSNIRNERIDTVNLEYLGPAKRFYLSIGRLFPKELPAERVDGLNLVFQNETSGVGVFGGFKPDPYTEELNPDYTTAGIYTFYRKDELAASLSFIHNGYQGGTDRQYIYGQTSYSPIREVRLFGLITADINPTTSDIDLTNAIAEISYRPVYSSGIAIGYNQFQAFKLYRSMTYDIVNTRQQSYYIRGDHRFWERYSIYGRYELRSQYYQLLEAELRYSNTYQVGFRNDNLVGSGVTLDTNATFDISYNSTYNTYRMDLSRFFAEILQMTVYGSYMESKYDINDYTDTIISYGSSAYLMLGRSWNLSLSYEGKNARDYSTNSVLSMISYRF